MAAPFFVVAAAFSAGSSGLALAMELIRIYQEITRLQLRNAAYVAGDLAAYDAAYGSLFFIAGTDVPDQPAAIATMPFWRIFTCIILLAIFLTEIPNTTIFVNAIGDYVIIWNKDVSIWLAGLLQAYLGLQIVGNLILFPIGPPLDLNEDTVAWTRLIAGFLLLGAGVINVILGLIYGPSARVYRGQVEEADSAGPPAAAGNAAAANARAVWWELKGVLSTLVASNANLGVVTTELAKMDAAIQQLA